VRVKKLAFGEDLFYTHDVAYYKQANEMKNAWVSHEVINGEVTHWMPIPEPPKEA
jgi:hypothetical protein